MQDEAIADAIGDLLSSGSRSQTQEMDRALWEHVASAGFDRALVPANLGGSGLALRDVQAIFAECGRYASPIPLGEAVLARGIAGHCSIDLPNGIVTLALATHTDERVRAHSVPWGTGADWVLAILPPAQACLFASGIGTFDSADQGPAGECDMLWYFADAAQVITLPRTFDALAAGAALRCAQIAGALDAVLELSQRHVTQRRQFGRALAQFQAIQQQMAVLAEDCFAARMAAAVACNSAEPVPLTWNVSVAKAVASEAAARACSIAHAVHGAMGMTAEYDLQRYTRRLRAWRVQYGSEHYWGRRLGNALLASDATAWEFVRA